ncbi:hypothetical protein Back11_40040 [Paenibacillus baekrokdamisoli]|uniref:Uncharacterized protein n=1 Tax=Paenibacillus baekrokdamisoli TaxID=1712516 RepID=A0A3G9JI21_9BACL|nr:hypothetical protein [Paenibacillus baekrokdamisoli]MBB3068299.1 hypothetical protein [Paenibacillus baekrokdamisoli]BBH22659.1 hypothetical protein Back11_40040 [Paenibacillus baekrokdamisoli]
MPRWIQAVRKYPLTALLRVFLTVLMIMTTLALFVTLTNSWSKVLTQWPNLGTVRRMKEIGTLISKPAEFGLYAAMGYWVLRELMIVLKGKPSVVFPLLRSVMLFLKRNHTFIGWFILLVAVSHGAFFLFAAKHSLKDLITGLGALTGLVIVSVIGMVFASRKQKKVTTTSQRKWHFSAAILFVVLFLIHLYL